MKKAVISVLSLLLLMSSSSLAISAAGSSFGSLSTARTLGMGTGNFGLSVGLADRTSVAGTLTYGLSAHTDGRIKLGLVDSDISDTELMLGADFKYQLISVEGIKNGPFDMAAGGFFEYLDLGWFSVLQVGAQFIGSYPFKLQNKTTLSPYGRFNVRLESISPDGPADSETNLEIGLNGGVEWRISNTMGLYGEFQIDGNDGVFFGIDFNIM